MDIDTIKKRNTVVGAGTESDARPNVRSIKKTAADHGIFLQLFRFLILSSWFSLCCICIVTTQLLGSPLYLFSKRAFDKYMAKTKESFGLVVTAVIQFGAPTSVRVSSDKSVQGQFRTTAEGDLKTEFPERLVMIANHQVYTDWMYLWWVAYTCCMHGRVYIILKESLKRIPVIGQGMLFYGFIFLARKWESDKPRLRHRLEKLKKKKYGVLDPMWLLIFPEGTNLSSNTKARSDAFAEKTGLPKVRHEVLPRSTGLFYCLQELKGTVDYVYDCTIGYEGPPKGSFPDKEFTLQSTFMRGRPPPTVDLYWRRFAIAEIPLDEPKEFESWLLKRWIEKDELLDIFSETGRFPPCDWGTEGFDGIKTPGYFEADIKLRHTVEVGNIFSIVIITGSVAYSIWKFFF